MKHQFIPSCLVLLIISAGTIHSASTKPAKTPGGNSENLEGMAVTDKALEAPSFRMEPIVGGYDAGTMGLPGFGTPEKLIKLVDNLAAASSESSSPKELAAVTNDAGINYDPDIYFPDELIEKILNLGNKKISGTDDLSEGLNENVTDTGNQETSGIENFSEDLINKTLSSGIKKPPVLDAISEGPIKNTFISGIKEITGTGNPLEGTVGTSYNVGGTGGQEVSNGIFPGETGGNPITRPLPVGYSPGNSFGVPGISNDNEQGFVGQGTAVFLDSGPIRVADEPRPSNSKPAGTIPGKYDSREFEEFPNVDYVLSYG